MDGTRDRTEWMALVRATWNERAERWDALATRDAAAPDRPADLDRIWEALRLRPGARLLDAGCGTGPFSIAFAHRGCVVTGIDLAPAMIERAQSHAAEAGVQVDWRVGDASELAAPMAIYDAIFARVMLLFVPDVAATLSSFRRQLKPGGTLLASVPGALSPIYNRSWRRFVDPESVRGTNFITPWELEAVLHAGGWRVVDGWGDFGESLTGEGNPFTPDEVSRLPIRLQQAAATTWTLIAR